MNQLSDFKNSKQSIIDNMYRKLENTTPENRYFNEKNIQDCADHLDTYIDKLITSSDSDKKDKEISKSIRWVYDRLSTFGKGDKKWGIEYLMGFIHNGYTNELTDFILKAAFAAGWKKNKPVIKKTDYFRIEYRTTYDYSDVIEKYGYDRFVKFITEEEKRPPEFKNHGFTGDCTLVIGAKKFWVSLIFNTDKRLFEFNANPYGDSNGMPILNVEVADDYSSLSFDLLSGSYKSYQFLAQYESDKVFFKLFKQLHGKGISKSTVKANHCNIELEFESGMLSKLDTTTHDDKNNIIPSAEGKNVYLLIQGFDEQGEMGSCAEGAPLIVSEKFILINFKGEYSRHEISQISFKNNILEIITKDKTFTYPIETIPLMMQTLSEVIKTREPFVSRYGK